MLRQLGGCRRPLSPLDLHFTALETKAGEVKLSRGEADPEPLLPDHLMWPKALLCLLTPPAFWLSVLCSLPFSILAFSLLLTRVLRALLLCQVLFCLTILCPFIFMVTLRGGWSYSSIFQVWKLRLAQVTQLWSVEPGLDSQLFCLLCLLSLC